MNPVKHLNLRLVGFLVVALFTSQTFGQRALISAWPPPETPAAGRVLSVLQGVARTYRDGRYSHSTRVIERTGHYEWDCSAMAAWVLRRAAPTALASIQRPRPVAADFYRVIHTAPTVGQRGGWRRVARIADARPGDVLAWQRPPWFHSTSSGHVAFVMEAPRAVNGGVLVRITDATSLHHQDDSRAEGVTGFGQGTLFVQTDATGAGTAYGWFGRTLPTTYIIPTPVVIGRVVR